MPEKTTPSPPPPLPPGGINCTSFGAKPPGTLGAPSSRVPTDRSSSVGWPSDAFVFVAWVGDHEPKPVLVRPNVSKAVSVQLSDSAVSGDTVPKLAQSKAVAAKCFSHQRKPPCAMLKARPVDWRTVLDTSKESRNALRWSCSGFSAASTYVAERVHPSGPGCTRRVIRRRVTGYSGASAQACLGHPGQPQDPSSRPCPIFAPKNAPLGSLPGRLSRRAILPILSPPSPPVRRSFACGSKASARDCQTRFPPAQPICPGSRRAGPCSWGGSHASAPQRLA